MLRVYCSCPGEVAVGDVDGDPLLALRLEAVREQREVRRLEAAPARGPLDGVERVGEDGLRVEEEPPDERALPVVHAAAGEEP